MNAHVRRAPVIAVLLLAAALPLALLAQEGGTSIEGTLKVPDAAQFVGPPQGSPLSGDALVQQTHRVASLIRCPVCQGMSIADSPSEMAVNMKGQVHELVARGYSEEQILKYFELSYGQFVLLKPKFEGVTGMVWVLPVIALLIGGAIVFVKFRNLEKSPNAEASADVPVATQAPPDEPSGDPYLDRVRDLVSGGKK
jgi:cytochrome c-type biogenesis protein CcmH